MRAPKPASAGARRPDDPLHPHLSEPNNWQAAGDVEHAAILAALIAGDEQGALTEMAHAPAYSRTGKSET
jgi:hypothetical protein